MNFKILEFHVEAKKGEDLFEKMQKSTNQTPNDERTFDDINEALAAFCLEGSRKMHALSCNKYLYKYYELVDSFDSVLQRTETDTRLI